MQRTSTSCPEARRRLSLDYGAIEYLVADGAAFVIDANKTMGEQKTFIERLCPAFAAFPDRVGERLAEEVRRLA